MTTHLALQRILLPSAQVSSLTTGSITLPSARQKFTPLVYDSISSTLLTSTSSSVTFSSIPSTYDHLQIRINGRGARTGNATSMKVTFNDDTATTYYRAHYLEAVGGTMYVGSDAGYIYIYDVFAAQNSPTNTFGSGIIDFFDYANTNKFKTIKSITGVENNSTASSGQICLLSGLWRDTSAITSITLTIYETHMLANTRISLYGIKAG